MPRCLVGLRHIIVRLACTKMWVIQRSFMINPTTRPLRLEQSINLHMTMRNAQSSNQLKRLVLILVCAGAMNLIFVNQNNLRLEVMKPEYAMAIVLGIPMLIVVGSVVREWIKAERRAKLSEEDSGKS